MPVWNPQANEIFLQALNQTNIEDRRAYLDQSCTDPELRRAVEALLAAHAIAGSFLEVVDKQSSPVETHTFQREGQTSSYSPDRSLHASGMVIAGRYTLVEKIGEGGMGEVWVAKQTDPVKRKVAIKLIKAGMDSKAVLARFEAERQALALMDHPNIAKVLDGGLTEDRRPFFVMELVNGLPLIKYCDEMKLTPNQRLELFVPICQAVQHAHQKGIVHRDLKPSNILITMYDGNPVPKVIDFGIAKATGGKLIDESITTQFGAVVGTLEYMAPEQAGFSTQDIDTRADIYSLGVLLYELLTGLRPFDAKRLKAAALDEMIRILREEEPSKPSTRLSTDGSLPSLAASRQIDPKKLTQLLRGELDWVVMKCLEKQRDRRYETTNGLLRDIQRYLANEPVEARPPSTRYRFKKFLSRNKASVVAASLLLFAIFAGIAGTTYGLIRAEHQRLEAEEARMVAQENEQKALNAVEAERRSKEAEANQRKLAIEFRDKALDALRATTGEDVEKLLGEKKELGANERAYLEAIAKRWQTFAQQEGTDEQALSIQAEGYRLIAYLWQKLGRVDEARLQYEKASTILKKLVEQFPNRPKYQNDLARNHNNFGVLLLDLGKREEARREHERAILLQKRLIEQFPDSPIYQRNLAQSHNNLANLLHTLGSWEEARREYEQAIVLQEKLVERFPMVSKSHDDLASSYGNLGKLLANLGKLEEAKHQYQKAIAMYERLIQQFPTVNSYQQKLTQIGTNLGTLLKELGSREEALHEFHKVLAIQNRLVEQFPNVPQNHHALASGHNNLGNLLRDMGKTEEAQSELQKAISIRKKLAEQFPHVPEYQIRLAGSYCNLGTLLSHSPPFAESLEWYHQAIQILAPLYQKEPREIITKQFLRNSYWGRARTYVRLRKYTEAITDLNQALVLSSKEDQLTIRSERAISFLRSNQIPESLQEVNELTKMTIWKGHQWYDFACIYAIASTKIPDKKQEYQNRAMELLHKAVQSGWKDGTHLQKDSDLDSLREREDFQKLLNSFPQPKGKELFAQPKEIKS